MREIKFRAWDKEEECFLDIYTMNFDGCGNIECVYVFDGDNYIDPPYFRDDKILVLMQYTGLKDKNGKDIYEGDIVEVVDYQYINEYPEIAKFIGVIEYNNGSFCVRMDETYSNYRLMDLEMKVIADIYESPELMRKE